MNLKMSVFKIIGKVSMKNGIQKTLGRVNGN